MSLTSENKSIVTQKSIDEKNKFVQNKSNATIYKEVFEMYLISVYFDEKTNLRISGYMKQIAKHTGNETMLEGNVPPHITIAAFQTDSESTAREIFRKGTLQSCGGKVQWVSVGCFLPNVIYIAPVLDEYLFGLSEIYNKEVAGRENVRQDFRYRPFSWFPHTTLAKKLSGEEMKYAFEVMQNQFGPFEGQVVKIGLAKTNPYTDLEITEIKMPD